MDLQKQKDFTILFGLFFFILFGLFIFGLFFLKMQKRYSQTHQGTGSERETRAGERQCLASYIGEARTAARDMRADGGCG